MSSILPAADGAARAAARSSERPRKSGSCPEQLGLVATDEWASFEEDGCVVLRHRLDGETLAALASALDDMMLRGVGADRLVMQLDSPDGVYAHAGEQSLGWKGATLQYRKIERLETHPVFSSFLASGLFAAVQSLAYRTPCPDHHVRAMMMNKSPRGGTELPLHQDRWDLAGREPRLSVYVAIDPAPASSGCMEVFPGTRMDILVSCSRHVPSPGRASPDTQRNYWGWRPSSDRRRSRCFRTRCRRG